ncbi:MAG: hypothetical protein SAMD01599839_23310 [Rectinema sp.]
MARSSQRAKLFLNKEERERLQKIAQSRTLPRQDIQRAEILLRYADGMLITEIEKDIHISRPTIYKWIDKALALGIEEGLKDKYHRPKAPVITEEAKAWVINIACKKPTDYGYAAEMWTRKSLADHVRHYGPEAGHDCLKKAVKATVHRILEEHPIRPHKMAYYLERRDPDFEKKMVDILCVYSRKLIFKTQRWNRVGTRLLLPFLSMKNLAYRPLEISHRILCLNQESNPGL